MAEKGLLPRLLMPGWPRYLPGGDFCPERGRVVSPVPFICCCFTPNRSSQPMASLPYDVARNATFIGIGQAKVSIRDVATGGRFMVLICSDPGLGKSRTAKQELRRGNVPFHECAPSTDRLSSASCGRSVPDRSTIRAQGSRYIGRRPRRNVATRDDRQSVEIRLRCCLMACHLGDARKSKE